MTSLRESIRWSHHPVPAPSAEGTLNISVGTVGSGGPTALITAGVHGDEGPWGGLAIHRLIDRLAPSELLGTIRIVPVSNPLAMRADTRNAPVDQLDLNRNFPGSPNGSYTEVVAQTIVEHALKGADVVIDLHGGGSWCVNAFVFRMQGGEALANAVPAPFVVDAPDRAVTLTGYARSQGARCVAIEMGGRSVQESTWADRIADGLHRVLTVTGVIAPGTPPAPIASPAIPVKATTVLRPRAGGVFIPSVGVETVGTIVAKGTLLGRMVDPSTFATREEFRAPYDRTAVMLLRPMLAQIEGGAMTYVVSEPLENTDSA